MIDPVELQHRYYVAHAEQYDDSHCTGLDEHDRALALFAGLAGLVGCSSVLDVGAGTGRALRALQTRMPTVYMVGVEPVQALRQAGIRRHGISPDILIAGDALHLEFADDSFDWVIATGVLHHVKNWELSVSEMIRVARVGVLLSDSNNMGQGNRVVRIVKQVIKALGLWKTFIWLQTQGRGYKESLGDGIYYSFCAFDCVPLLSKKFDQVSFVNTLNSGPNLYRDAGHVAILAWRQSAQTCDRAGD